MQDEITQIYNTIRGLEEATSIIEENRSKLAEELRTAYKENIALQEEKRQLEIERANLDDLEKEKEEQTAALAVIEARVQN